MQSVYLSGDETLLGQMVTLTVTQARQNSLYAEMRSAYDKGESEESVA